MNADGRRYGARNLFRVLLKQGTTRGMNSALAVRFIFGSGARGATRPTYAICVYPRSSAVKKNGESTSRFATVSNGVSSRHETTVARSIVDRDRPGFRVVDRLAHWAAFQRERRAADLRY